MCGENYKNLNHRSNSLWNFYFYRVKGNDDSEMTLDDMEKFHSLLLQYLKESYGISFEKWTLTNILLPSLSAAATGMVSKVLKIVLNSGEPNSSVRFGTYQK